MTLDLTKPVQLSDGTPARVICPDRKSDNGYNVIVLAKNNTGGESVWLFKADGTRDGGGLSLVNVPLPKASVTGYLFRNHKNRKVFISSTRYGWCDHVELIGQATITEGEGM